MFKSLEAIPRMNTFPAGETLISSAKFLHKKQLNVQAKKYLKKAKVMAEDNERFLLLIEIL